VKTLFYKSLLHLAPDAESARFLLAVSGGRDSVVMAHLFANCGLHFDIAHCNFHLRGDDSNKEMNFVEKLSFLTTQKVLIKEFDTISIQHKSGKSIEMVARELRYQWFTDIGKEYDYIVTAHHANDNAETVLMNMLRGTGLRGMCGIPHRNGKIIRPLLKFGDSEIEKYCRDHKIQFCVDLSNLTDDFLRNRIRHAIIPELKKINPHVIQIFSKNSALFEQQIQFFDAHIQRYKSRLVKQHKGRLIISLEILKTINYQYLILYEILHPFGFNANDVSNILKSINSNPGKQFLSDTHILIKDRTHFIVERKTKKMETNICINTIEDFEKHGFKVEKIICNSDSKFIKAPNMIYVDVNKITFPLEIRNWKQGDFFYPFGMKSRKKLSDFFTDLKMDLLTKSKVQILCAQNQIIWIINYRADDRFKIAVDTKYCYKITANL